MRVNYMKLNTAKRWQLSATSRWCFPSNIFFLAIH